MLRCLFKVSLESAMYVLRCLFKVSLRCPLIATPQEREGGILDGADFFWQLLGFCLLCIQL